LFLENKTMIQSDQPRRRRFTPSAIIAGLCAALALVALPGCPPTQSDGTDGNGDGGDATQGAVVDVSMQNIAFNPQTVTIKVGDSVRWTNNDVVPHTATSGNPGDADAGSVFDSGTLAGGQSFTHQFDQSGEFVYFCGVHPLTMRDARVIVEP
jgi:plastocyanin